MLKNFTLCITTAFLVFICFTSFSAQYYSGWEKQTVSSKQNLGVYEDKSCSLDISELITTDFDFEKSSNFGHTYATIWYKFKITNNDNENLFLEISPEWSHNITLYKIGETKNQNFIKEGGTLQPYAKRELKNNRHCFALLLENRESATYYVKIHGDHIIAPHFVIGDKNDLVSYNYSVDQIYFIYLGIMWALLVYNVFLAFIIRKRSYAYYACYIFCMMLSLFFVEGYINKFADLFYLSNHSNAITSTMCVFLILSISIITKAKVLYPKLHKIGLILIGISSLSIILNLLNFVLIANVISLNCAFFIGIWGIYMGVMIMKQNNKSSKSMFIGYTCFITGGVVHLLRLNGVIPFNFFTQHAYLIGSSLEVIFLTISFGVSVDELRKQKYKNKIELLKLAQEKEQLIKEQHKILEEKVLKRTQELNTTNEKLEGTLDIVHNQKRLLEEEQKKISDSINYAKSLQDALLCSKEDVKSTGLDIGIFYEPKDVLSGDFYWFSEREGLTFLAVADCTGHGVPGAILSISGHNLLNKIVFEKRITEVDMILEMLHIELIELLHSHRTNTEDGMDIQLICWDKSSNEVSFSGAKNHLFYTNTKNEFITVKADRKSIGGTIGQQEPNFTKHTLPPDWDNIFLYTDGYQDQFSKNNRKFMVKNFKMLLHLITEHTTIAQIQELRKTFVDWKGYTIQTDDVLVISLKKTA